MPDTNNHGLSLTIYSNTGRLVESIDKLPAILGRASDCDIVISEDSVSSHHAMLSIEDGALTISDMGSTNGTYLKRRKISKSTLTPPVEIRLGNLVTMLEGNAPTSGEPGNEANASVEEATATPNRTPVKREPKDCYYRRSGHEFGPFTWTKLKQLAGEGQLQETDMIWTGLQERWLSAEQVPGLLKDEEEAEASESTAGKAIKPVKQRKHTLKRGDITCPHCWYTFDVEDFLYIAQHNDLLGDPVLGEDAQQRFMPSRFTAEGHAIDSAGLICPDVACPRCHLRIARAAREKPPLFISIVGAAASGKSYFLTTMIWHLRSVLARNFAMSFNDTDAINNQIINEYEERLFLNSLPDELTALRKTELQGELYNEVLLDGILTNLPKPFMFTIKPAEHHPDYDKVQDRLSRTLVLYDNAGEHFEPGMDSVDNPTTRHIQYSDTLFYLFDPTKDVRFRQRCLRSEDPQLKRGAKVQRQEVILTEMINRVMKYCGDSDKKRSDKQLVIIVPKADVWLDLLGYDPIECPWEWDDEKDICALDINEIMAASFSIRVLLQDLCPEMIATADSFAREVLFIPTSAFGRSPEQDETSGTLGIRPVEIEPYWITVPMLWLFYHYNILPALDESMRDFGDDDLIEIDYKIKGDIAFVRWEGRKIPLQVPLCYTGYTLRCPDTDKWFRIPKQERK